MVSAAHAADVHFHGLHAVGKPKIADDLYKMFHVWMGPCSGGLAIGTILLMVLISAMNGLSVAGMAIGATIALPELLRRGYDKRMVTGVIQAGSIVGHSGAALGGPRALCDDRTGSLSDSSGLPASSRADDGGHVHCVYIAVRCKLQPASWAPPLR
jgi:hypothetical protein